MSSIELAAKITSEIISGKLTGLNERQQEIFVKQTSSIYSQIFQQVMSAISVMDISDDTPAIQF